ncbi:MAG: nicotinate-nucleotide--dimethylbenzimidazole phosphoribosyltransferase [Acidaminococcaceae bacterium]
MFKDIISRIKPLDIESMDKCQLRLDNLTKPLNSLLYFEHIARQMAGITHNPRPRTLKKSIIILTGAGAKPSIVTNVFAEHVGAQIVTADIATIAKAQTAQQEILSAIEWGINSAGAEIAKGTQVIGLGQLDSGSAADSKEILACVSDEQAEPLEVLAKVGSKTIAALVGLILGAAAGGAAVVLDGLSTTVAAMLAVKIAPGVKDYLIGSHYATVPEHKVALDTIGIPAYLYMDMNSDDGTGAAMGMSLIKASLHVLNDMKTFGEAEVAVAQDGPGALKQTKEVKDI